MNERLGRLHDELISHFLCEYSPLSPKKKLEEVVQVVAARIYAQDVIDEYTNKWILNLQAVLVGEFNNRILTDSTLRYEIVDPLAEGRIIRGRKTDPSDRRIEFQDALNAVAPDDFEALAALVLERMGCKQVFLTPQSHDQGVDAFGYQAVAPSFSRAVTHRLVWIAQAKHYVTHGVSTNAIRELVGTNELLVSKIFSTVDARYQQLDLRPYGPAALLLLTTHEMPSTVRRYAERSGVFVLEASDLYELFSETLTVPFSASNLTSFIRSGVFSIPLLS